MKFVKTRVSSPSPPNAEIPATIFRPRDHNAPGKIGEASPVAAGYIHEEMARGLSRAGGLITSPTLLGPVLM